MSNYSYNDEFSSISGIIYGTDFDAQFKAIEVAVNSKADIAGPVTHTGTHTIADLVVSGTVDIDGGTWV
tara:strand:- start:11542 stop:11748 length:207 start_codon:yes stop_codon:yes gene_type:complete